MPELDKFLALMADNQASDFHLSVGMKPRFRIHGDLIDHGDEVMTAERGQQILFELLTEKQQAYFHNRKDIDFVYRTGNQARFRVNIFHQLRGVCGVFRKIPEVILDFKDLQLPPVIQKFTEYRSGLVLITGPTGSGKSTTLASIIDYINTNFRKHIVTIEDPIEFSHTSKNSIIHQRQIGLDALTFELAIKGAMREDPEVLLVGEMRDAETIQATVTAAEIGILVFATVHTNSAGKTMDRIIDSFPAEKQALIRAMLSQSLRGVVSQLLLKTADRKGRIPACEVLIATHGVQNLIR
ncbi:MAG: PilT/PilU family type 4a pilus ATPase, partial [Planctomycetota bacterium]|nr:PilT/PilU family type 4a pilus ATPase [Planctomycetota bacterium]